MGMDYQKKKNSNYLEALQTNKHNSYDIIYMISVNLLVTLIYTGWNTAYECLTTYPKKIYGPYIAP